MLSVQGNLEKTMKLKFKSIEIIFTAQHFAPEKNLFRPHIFFYDGPTLLYELEYYRKFTRKL